MVGTQWEFATDEAVAAAAGADSGSISPSFVLGIVLYNRPPGR